MFLRLLSVLFFFLIISAHIEAQDADWQPLFNGKTLDGWTETGDFKSEIKEGAVHLIATHPFNNAWLFTEKDYANFKLELEFLMDDGANSGVLFRYNPVLTGALNTQAFEANIDWNPDIQGPLGTIEHAARATILPDIDKTLWNKMRIEANNDHLLVFINDQKVCETHNRRSLTGKIGLQVPIRKGGTIAFRKINIQVLPDTELSTPLIEDYYRTTWERPLTPLLTDDTFEGWHTIGPGTWTMEEGGVLHGYSGETPSYLISDASYHNFYMRYKFKLIKEDNSGVFIRKHPDSSNVSLQDAIECNMYDFNGMGAPYTTGSIVTHARAWAGIAHYEDWNTMEIFAHDSHIILYVNGRKSAEAYVPESFNKPGQICLQAGVKVFGDNGPCNIYFKEIRLRNMDGL